MNPFLYILISLPIINTLLCKVPLTVLIIYLFKLFFHVFDYFVEKKEGATVKEGLSQGATKAYQEVKTTCIDLRDRVCEVGKEFVRSMEAKHYPTEVKESPKEFTVFLDAPGMKKEDFKVEAASPSRTRRRRRSTRNVRMATSPRRFLSTRRQTWLPLLPSTTTAC